MKTSSTPEQKVSRNSKVQRKPLSPKIKTLLYTRAGGYCQLCHTYLLESDDIGYYEFNRGEMAHIVGQSLDTTSPRSDFPLPKESRDEVDNLMLLCAIHHQTIDSRIAQGDFTVELLRDLKREQEARIKHVTGIPQNHKTCIVRLIGRIRGNIVQITRSECNGATLFHTPSRFADFSLDFNRQGVEVDLNSLGEPEENPYYYPMAMRLVDERIQLIRQGIEGAEIEHLSIFALARIPVLVYFGFQLGNKVGNTIFQKRRTDAKHWHWLKESATRQFEWMQVQNAPDKRKVALILNVSGSIDTGELPDEIISDFNIYVLKTKDIDPNPDVILTQESLQEFRTCYRLFLATIEAKHKLAPSIHVFPSVPISVALACGLDLMPHVQPEFIIYDRMPRQFIAVLSVNSTSPRVH